MFSPDQYALLDFGAGRRLERFGDSLIDRPAPAVEDREKRLPEKWTEADFRFQRDSDRRKRGIWRTFDGRFAEDATTWTIEHPPFRLELRRTPFGHLGVFPEQAENWDRLGRWCSESASPLRVLNLFGYTGASTLAVAAAGAEATHVDAAGNVVAWARRNAAHSGLREHPIRWIAEDARKFTRREIRRKRRYHGVILDPPSYGHGAKGEVWRLGKHLPQLLRDGFHLMGEDRVFLMLTSHTPGYDEKRLSRLVRRAEEEATGGNAGTLEAFPLRLHDGRGRSFPSGYCVCWHVH
jgi:23S rRNA (cytosine1962-C5)-methyltransferase